MAKFRKKPVVVDAVRLTERIEVETLEGIMVGNPGDWLITGVSGEKYPIKDEIFRATYKAVLDEETEGSPAGSPRDMTPEEKSRAEAIVKPLMRFAIWKTADVIVRIALDPYLAYIVDQDNLPEGYQEVIQGYRDEQYDADHLMDRLDAIDNAEAYFRLMEEYEQTLPPDLEEGDP